MSSVTCWAGQNVPSGMLLGDEWVSWRFVRWWERVHSSGQLRTPDLPKHFRVQAGDGRGNRRTEKFCISEARKQGTYKKNSWPIFSTERHPEWRQSVFMGVPRTSEVTADGDRVRLAFRPPSPNFWVLWHQQPGTSRKLPRKIKLALRKPQGQKMLFDEIQDW